MPKVVNKYIEQGTVCLHLKNIISLVIFKLTKYIFFVNLICLTNYLKIMKSVQKLNVVLVYGETRNDQKVGVEISAKQEGFILANLERKNGCVGCFFSVISGFEDEDGVEYTKNFFSGEHFYFGRKWTYFELDLENKRLGNGKHDFLLAQMLLRHDEAVVELEDGNFISYEEGKTILLTPKENFA